MSEKLLERFPKVAPPLEPKLVEIFDREYKDNREGTSFLRKLCQELEGWMHRRVARNAPAADVLELGAGTLNHLQYESNVATYDVVEPFSHWYEGKPELAYVGKVYSDVAEISDDKRYGRIISIATLEHVLDLPVLLAHCSRLLRDDGEFQAAIPSEGGFSWGLSWRMTTGLMFRLRTGHDYGQLMRHEHVNTADEIVSLIELFFEEVQIERFPFNHPHFSFYTYISAKKPKNRTSVSRMSKGVCVRE